MRMRSVHSPRALATHRSQIAFARGAWTGVLMMWMPAAVKTASNASVYLASRSLIRNFKPPARSPESMSVFRACWTVQAAVGGAGTPARCTRRGWCSMRKRTESRRRKTVPTWKKAGRDDRLGLGGQELLPARGFALWCGVDAGFLEDLPDGGGRDLVPEARELAADPPVAPGRVVAGHLEREAADRRPERTAARRGRGDDQGELAAARCGQPPG